MLQNGDCYKKMILYSSNLSIQTKRKQMNSTLMNLLSIYEKKFQIGNPSCFLAYNPGGTTSASQASLPAYPSSTGCVCFHLCSTE